MPAKILRLFDVLQMTSLSRSSIERLEAKGLFPRRRRLGSRAVGWVAEDIEDWIHQRNHWACLAHKQIDKSMLGLMAKS